MGNRPPLLRKISKIVQRGDRMKSRLLYPYLNKKGDSTLYILKRDGSTKPFKVLAAVQNYGIEDEDDGMRTRTVFSYAPTAENFGPNSDKTFGEILSVATHVAKYPDGEVYSIRQAGELQVRYTNFVYSVFGEYQGDQFIPE